MEYSEISNQTLNLDDIVVRAQLSCSFAFVLKKTCRGFLRIGDLRTATSATYYKVREHYIGTAEQLWSLQGCYLLFVGEETDKSSLVTWWHGGCHIEYFCLQVGFLTISK